MKIKKRVYKFTLTREISDSKGLRYFKCDSFSNKSTGNRWTSFEEPKSKAELMFVLSPTLQLREVHNEDIINKNFVWNFPFDDIPKRLKAAFEKLFLFGCGNSINAFTHLHTVNVSNLSITFLPEEFCGLVTLKECYLSHNKISYLPDDIGNLLSLTVLHLNDNEIKELPFSVNDLRNLREFDLYNNRMEYFPLVTKCVDAIDLAQNYTDEPFDPWYRKQKRNLRSKYNYIRYDDFKIFHERSSYEDCDSTKEDEQSDCEFNLQCVYNDDQEENWESDDFWDPSIRDPVWPDAKSLWDYYIINEQKKAGFKPAILNLPPTYSQVPAINMPFIDGQFDDDC